MLKKIFSSVTIASLATLSLQATPFNANFANPLIWDGHTIPKTEVCSNYNTKAGATPEIIVRKIPKGTSALLLTFTDETFQGMRNGGHGVLSYALEEDTFSVIIPSVAGETFDLPKDFRSIKEHRGTKYGKTAGAYLAPCSGGKGNTYSVLIQAVDQDLNELDRQTLILGKY